MADSLTSVGILKARRLSLSLILALCLVAVVTSDLDSTNRLSRTRAVASTLQGENLNESQTRPQTDLGPLEYTVIVVMENKNYSNIIGSKVAPYTNRFASDYGIAANYYDVSNGLSLPNYLGLTTGQTYDSWSACNKPPAQCPGFSPITLPTIVDSIESAGLTWKAYMEDMPSNCYQDDFGLYVARHDPFVYFNHVVTSPFECDLVVPAETNSSRMISDLNSTITASNFMWLTPNLCNDMHNCSVSVGDKYLSLIVPEILNSTVFQTRPAALFVTWDEGWSSNSTHVPAIWAGPSIRNNYTSSFRHNHYSLLKTLETVWHLSPLTASDAQASAMTEFLKPPIISFTYTPSHSIAGQMVTFNATSQGGTWPYAYNWNFGDGRTSSGELARHTYAMSGSFRVSLSVTDTLNNTASTSKTLEISASPQLPLPGPNPLSAPALPLLGFATIVVMTGSAAFTFAIGILITMMRKRNDTNKNSRPS